MKKKTITTPIVLLKVKGNFKEKASVLTTTAVCSYEKHIDQTFIVVKVEDEDSLEKVVSIYKDMVGFTDVVEKVFSKNGIDFITK